MAKEDFKNIKLGNRGSNFEQFKFEPIIPGENLQRQGSNIYLQAGNFRSPYFLAGNQGWSINSDGIAEFQEIISGQSVVDQKLKAGEAINKRNAVGMTGEITKETLAVLSNSACYINEAATTTTHDNVKLELWFTTDGRKKRILCAYDLMPTIPSATGLTILSIQVKVFLWASVNGVNHNDRNNSGVHPNTATFDETNATWNNAPANNSSIGNFPAETLFSQYIDTGYVTITSTQYNNIRNNGVTIQDNAGQEYIDNTYSDNNGNNTNNKPKIDVKFTYKITDGKIYKVKATTAEYAASYKGQALETKKKGETLKYRVDGIIEDDGYSLAEFKTHYLSDTDGQIDDSPGSTSKIIGQSLESNKLQVKYSI